MDFRIRVMVRLDLSTITMGMTDHKVFRNRNQFRQLHHMDQKIRPDKTCTIFKEQKSVETILLWLDSCAKINLEGGMYGP